MKELLDYLIKCSESLDSKIKASEKVLKHHEEIVESTERDIGNLEQEKGHLKNMIKLVEQSMRQAEEAFTDLVGDFRTKGEGVTLDDFKRCADRMSISFPVEYDEPEDEPGGPQVVPGPSEGFG